MFRMPCMHSQHPATIPWCFPARRTTNSGLMGSLKNKMTTTQRQGLTEVSPGADPHSRPFTTCQGQKQVFSDSVSGLFATGERPTRPLPLLPKKLAPNFGKV